MHFHHQDESQSLNFFCSSIFGLLSHEFIGDNTIAALFLLIILVKMRDDYSLKGFEFGYLLLSLFLFPFFYHCLNSHSHLCSVLNVFVYPF